MKTAFSFLSLLCFAILSSPAAQAEVSAADAAKLGTSLTPLGAEKAGNNAAIPAWQGGLTKPVAGFKPGSQYPDPYAADKIAFTISSANLDQHRDKLSPGQIALLKKYPTWKMHVYPTRRSATYPQKTLDQTIENATKARLVPSGAGVTGADGGIPFPIPKNGLEAIWNSCYAITVTRMRRPGVRRRSLETAITRWCALNTSTTTITAI